MKSFKYIVTVISFALVALLALNACSSPVAAQDGPAPQTGQDTLVGENRGNGSNATENGQGQTDSDHRGFANSLEEASGGELSDAEAQGILYMREEEKLARDVYLALGEQWSIPVFGNIASSESTHMEAVRALIDRYDLEDPVEGKARGEFANQDLQALYNQLVEQGSQSLADALKVGAAIEEIDILDLQTYTAQTENADIQRVYDNLTRGSRNHLRSFVSLLEQQGETYEPVHLGVDEFDEIINTPVERGGGQNGSGGQGSRAGQGGRSTPGGAGEPNGGSGQNSRGSQGRSGSQGRQGR